MKTRYIKEINFDVPAYETAARAHERDNGRRGEPLPGCDCLRCFGRCSIDQDAAVRELRMKRERYEAHGPADGLRNLDADLLDSGI